MSRSLKRSMVWRAGSRCMTCMARPGSNAWVHEMADHLKALPKSVQPKAKAYFQDSWIAETKASANTAFDFFVEAFYLVHGVLGRWVRPWQQELRWACVRVGS